MSNILLLLLIINSCVRCDLVAFTLMHINAPNCSCGWSTSALVGHIDVRVYARAETDCIPSSTNAFMNLCSSIIIAKWPLYKLESLQILPAGVTDLDWRCKTVPFSSWHGAPVGGIQVFCMNEIIVIHQMCMSPAFKVFWSSGRPLLCFSRFWPFENVAWIRSVYFAYSRTKSVHTRNLALNAKGKCVFVLIAPNDRITSYIAGQVGGQDKIS